MIREAVDSCPVDCICELLGHDAVCTPAFRHGVCLRRLYPHPCVTPCCLPVCLPAPTLSICNLADFVPKGQLPLLEFVMKGCKRESVAIMGRRRSGNMGSAPATECPFNRAASYVKARKDAKVEEVLGADGARARAHDEVLAAAIAKAWLQLPRDVREKAWPEWASKAGALTF